MLLIVCRGLSIKSLSSSHLNMKMITLFEGPCTNCDFKAACSIYPELKRGLYDRKQFQNGDSLDETDKQLDVISNYWLSSVASSITQPDIWEQEDVELSLAALFDTLCSALYARETIPSKTTPKYALRCNDEFIFPYTWMCPRCVSIGKSRDECYLPNARREVSKGVTRDYPLKNHLAKPGSRLIGDVGIKVLRSILRVILSVSPISLRMSEGGGRRGEFDLTFSSLDMLMFGEVKAKPLIAFPLIAKDTKNNISEISTKHNWIKLTSNEYKNLSLFVASSNLLIDVGLPSSESPLWPLEALEATSQDSHQVHSIIRGWRKHLEAYRAWRKEPDNLRWHRFGCGNFSVGLGAERVERRVANTKELPGLDRTDDIKKGASQVLLFSRFKLGCEKQALKSALLGNVYAETHGTDYLDRLSTMQVTGQAYNRTEWIFDLILGLTRNVFNDLDLENIFGTKNVITHFTKLQRGLCA